MSVDGEQAAAPPERKRKETADSENEAYRIYREIICDNIEYDILLQDKRIDRDRLDEIVDIILETVCSSRKKIRIAGDDYSRRILEKLRMFVYNVFCIIMSIRKRRRMKGYLSIRETSYKWGVSERRVNQYISQGRVPGAPGQFRRMP